MDETSITALESEELEMIVRDMQKTAAGNALAALKPGDILPGGKLCVVPNDLQELVWIRHGPWGAYKSALMEKHFNDRHFTEAELTAKIVAAVNPAAKEDGDG